MDQYHKIQTVFKRDEATKHIIEGDYSMPEFDYLKDNDWVFTEKVDGTNVRVGWNGKAIIFGGKTDDAQMPVFLMQKLQEMFDTTPKRQVFKTIFNLNEETADVCLYGEGYGKKIQAAGNLYKPDGTVDFVLFDIKIGEWWLERSNVEDIASKLGVKVVPIIGQGTLKDAIEMTRKGFKSQWGDFDAEGIVARPSVELVARSGDRIITKIKHRDFR